MSEKIKNLNFFKQRATQPAPAKAPKESANTPAAPITQPVTPTPTAKAAPTPAIPNVPTTRLSAELRVALDHLVQALEEIAQPQLAAQTANIAHDALCEQFSIAVVGEFCRGKSTFINRLLGRELLPTGNLPTTSLLTRIRGHEQEVMLEFNQQGKKLKTLPVRMESWNGLTAELFGEPDQEGSILIGVKHPWLSGCHLEIIDTPGAGDLDKKRAQRIGDALLGADGAIITVSATNALSESELLFIRQRLLTRKTPFLMLILTKMDEVPMAERPSVIRYVTAKLYQAKINIPVYIPYPVEMPDDTYANIIGMDKVQAQIAGWLTDPERVRLTESWIASRALTVIEAATTALKEQEALLVAGDDQRRAMIDQKKQLLDHVHLEWEDLRLELLKRRNDCVRAFIDRSETYKCTITERLQFQASHSGDLQRWWKEDYPYLLKNELANMSATLENIATQTILSDARWFNMSLEQRFKATVMYEKGDVMNGDAAGATPQTSDPRVSDLHKQRNVARVATTALSIAGAFVCSSLGFAPLVATMGLGTGASIITETIFRRKIEEQRDAVKKALAKNIPEMIDKATADSEIRISAMYDDIVKAAEAKEETWMAAQRQAIENSNLPQRTSDREKLAGQITALDNLTKALNAKV